GACDAPDGVALLGAAGAALVAVAPGTVAVFAAERPGPPRATDLFESPWPIERATFLEPGVMLTGRGGSLMGAVEQGRAWRVTEYARAHWRTALVGGTRGWLFSASPGARLVAWRLMPRRLDPARFPEAFELRYTPASPTRSPGPVRPRPGPRTPGAAS